MSAEGSGAAARYGAKRLQLLIADRGLVAFQKLPALCADDVGHFHGRPGHGCKGR